VKNQTGLRYAETQICSLPATTSAANAADRSSHSLGAAPPVGCAQHSLPGGPLRRYPVRSSLAFGALARVVCVAAQRQNDDEGKPGARVLMLAKSNIGLDKGGFEYELQQSALYIIASVVSWGDAIDGNARDVLAEAETVKDKDDDKATALPEAKDFLLDLLKDGPLPTKEVQAAARNAGQSWRTLGRAKAELKISTGNRVDGWPWSLPQDQLCHGEEGLHPKTLAELADIKKVKQKQKIHLCQDLCQHKNLAEIVGRDENWQNQEVKPPLPTLPSLPGCGEGNAHQAPDDPVEVEL
jgi:hypothetical protein